MRETLKRRVGKGSYRVVFESYRDDRSFNNQSTDESEELTRNKAVVKSGKEHEMHGQLHKRIGVTAHILLFVQSFLMSIILYSLLLATTGENIVAWFSLLSLAVHLCF
jgi:hypothetical protein